MAKDQGHRERLLAAATRLVLRKGLSATRVDEVCGEAGVTKGSFYHHFESKDQMSVALLEDFFGKLAGALLAGGWMEAESPRERLQGMLDRAIEVAEGPLLKNGCILGILTVDMADVNEDVRSDLGSKFHAVTELVAPVIEAAMADAGRAPAAARNESNELAKQFIAVMEGGILLGKATRNQEQVADSLRCFRRLAISALR